MNNLLLCFISSFLTQQKVRKVFYDCQHGSQSKSHSKHCCCPKSIMYLLCKLLHIIKRQTSSSIDFSSFGFRNKLSERSKEGEKERKPKRFWTRPGRTGKCGQNFPDLHLSLSSSLVACLSLFPSIKNNS